MRNHPELAENTVPSDLISDDEIHQVYLNYQTDPIAFGRKVAELTEEAAEKRIETRDFVNRLSFYAICFVSGGIGALFVNMFSLL